ncbi:MAG: ethanolamine ammonia-lyase reactivating factor EutA, partial [Gemmataceae bacterium]|nr:ethanolamine ammonia-lyase reactivating factor EutA [Gemmataceae bacterium]
MTATTVKLIGLDFGTTTSSAVVATATLTRNSVTGRTDLADVRETFRAPMAFTPLRDDRIDEREVENYLDAWLSAGGVKPGEVFGGGALLTGLTAQRANADALVRLVRRRLGDALIANADDPCLESWLAFMGNCSALSRAHPDTYFLNLDIGGGTTNLALGKAGEVLRTGCLFVGARHVQVEPGTYRIARLSRYAQTLLDHLGIRNGPGDTLTENEVSAILDFYLALLDAAASGSQDVFAEPTAALHQQVALRLPTGVTDLAVPFSGGVGELIYAHIQGQPWPPTTHYGDLGIDLARRLVESPRWAAHLKTWQPASAGRATVYGLLRHNTEISGSTLFLPQPQILPLNDMPILGSISATSADEEMRTLADLARRSERGSCLRVTVGSHDASAVRELGGRIAGALREQAFPAGRPLVLLVRENVGKVLGHYVTEWGALPLNLVVIDEVAVRDAQYARIGRPRAQVVPVSFYGLNEQGGRGSCRAGET